MATRGARLGWEVRRGEERRCSGGGCVPTRAGLRVSSGGERYWERQRYQGEVETEIEMETDRNRSRDRNRDSKSDK